MNGKGSLMPFANARPHRLTGEGTGFLNPESPFESGWGCQGASSNGEGLGLLNREWQFKSARARQTELTKAL